MENEEKKSWIDWSHIEWEKYVRDIISKIVIDLEKSKGLKVHQLLNWRDRTLKYWKGLQK